METKTKGELKIIDFFFYAFCLIAVLLVMISFAFIDFKAFNFEIIPYMCLIAIPLAVLGILGTIQITKNNANYKKKLFIFWGLVAVVFFVTIYFANYVSSDYYYYLNPWCESYKSMSFKDCLYHIFDVSNYTPVYNYFLILFAKTGVNSLYAIKYLTFLFSILLAISMELLISKISGSKFNILHLMIFLLVPTICTEFSWWGQCDAIYTSFCLLAFYFALSKKSKLSFLFVGIAFAFKLQFLFIVPILFVLLIIKDENGEHYLKWKDIWIGPVMYLLNILPVFVGRSFVDVLSVYFTQGGFYDRLSQDCANLCSIFDFLGLGSGFAYKFLLVFQVLISITIVLLFVIFLIKYSKSNKLTSYDLTFFATIISFCMVFFMPKMLDRFYFLTVSLGIVLYFSKKTTRNFQIATLLEISLYYVMFYSFKNTQNWVLYLGLFTKPLALLINIMALVLMIKTFVSDYLKNKNNLSLQISSQDNASTFAKENLEDNESLKIENEKTSKESLNKEPSTEPATENENS